MLNQIRNSCRDSVEDLQRIHRHLHVRITNLFTKNIHDLPTQPMLREFPWIGLDQSVENCCHAMLSNLPIT